MRASPVRLGWRPPRGDWQSLLPPSRGGSAATVRDPRIVDDWLALVSKGSSVTVLQMTAAMRWTNVRAVARAVRLLFELFPDDTAPLAGAAPSSPEKSSGQRLACHPLIVWHMRRMLCVLEAVACRWDGRVVLHDMDMELDALRRRRGGECVLYIPRHRRAL